MNNNIEVLSPAGDFERLVTAIKYGADAVYVGGSKFGMRSSSNKFDSELLPKAVKYCHDHNVKLYVTCNTVPLNEEVDIFSEFLNLCNDSKVDGLIVADIGLLSMIKKQLPNMEVHISTQAGIMNYSTAQAFYDMGAKRIVLARELSIDDIGTIRAKTPKDLEIEAFVHGSMCMAISGRCLISNYLQGRDANRGECSQPCRWSYYLVEERNPDIKYPIFEDEKGTHILNAKDLCMVKYIDKVIEAGVTSLKIEGRSKSSYYVAVTTNAYRLAVDIYLKNPTNFKLDDWIYDEIVKVSHRQYSTGFYFGKPKDDQCYDSGGYIRTFDIIATVENSDGKFLECTQKNKFSVGDIVEIFQPKQKPIEMKIEKIYDKNDNEITDACHPMMKIKIPYSGEIVSGAMIRREQKEK